MLKRMWRGWLRLVEVLGTVQMVILLSIVYWTLLAVTALPHRLLADPLSLRRPATWRPRANPQPQPGEPRSEMRRQY